MDIRKEILQDRNKANIQRVAEYVGDDVDRFAELMHLVLGDQPRVAELASWPMTIVCEEFPEQGLPWIEVWIRLLETPVHQAIHRNVLRSMQFTPLPTSYHGRLTDLTFRLIADASQPIASRAFSITVAMRLVLTHPELATEMMTILETTMIEDPGPAIRSRATKAMRRIARLPGSR